MSDDIIVAADGGELLEGGSDEADIEKAREHASKLLEYVSDGYPSGNLLARVEMLHDALGMEVDVEGAMADE